MAYYTSSAANATGLRDAIEAFCISNGWTLDASGYIWKGKSFVKLTAPSANEVRIVGANSADGTVDPCSLSRSLYNSTWPATYELFVHTSPDMCVCVLNYNVSYIKPLIFGDIVKVHEDAYVGGNWFYAPNYSDCLTASMQMDIVEDVIGCFIRSTRTYYAGGNTNCPQQIPFAKQDTATDGYSGGNPSNCLHAEIDGNIWNTRTSGTGSTLHYVDHTRRMYNRSPNQWNNQAILIPMHLQLQATAYNMYLGYVEHMRLIRIDYYNIGDIIDLTPDKWKVYPWRRKDTTYRDGQFNETGAETRSGTLGFAVRYDGP